MGLFSLKLAPGVRLSVSSRGPRAHLGPRMARVHVGGGRSGISTGAGPVTLYSGLGSAPRRRTTSGSTSGMTPAQAEKARQVEEAAAAWDELSRLHRVSFPAVAAPGAVPAEPVPMFAVLMRDAERRQLKGLGRFDRAARQEARVRARSEAELEAMRLLSEGFLERAERQEASDRAWAALASGEPEAVVAAVQAALTGRGLDVVVASDSVGHVHLNLAFADEESVPTHQPALTPAGRPTLKKLTKTEAAYHVRQLVAAHALLAAKETFAQSPGILVVEVSTRRGRDVLVRGRLAREQLESADWSKDAWKVLEDVDPHLGANIGGRTQELRPLK